MKLRDECGGILKQELVSVKFKSVKKKVKVSALKCQKCGKITLNSQQAKLAAEKLLSLHKNNK